MSDDEGRIPSGREPLGAGRRFGVLHTVHWISIAVLVLVAVAYFLQATRGESVREPVTQQLVVVLAFVLTSALLLGRHPAGPRLSHGLGARPTHPWLPLLGLAAGATLQFPARAVLEWSFSLAPMDSATERALEALFHTDGTLHTAAVVIVTVCLVPVAEEMFFRGALFGALRRSGHSSRFAATVTGVGFVLVHLDLRMMPMVALAATLFSVLRAVSGSIVPSLLAHVAFNAVGTFSEILGWFSVDGEPASVPASMVASYGALTLALAGLAAWVGRSSEVAAVSRMREMSAEPAEEPDHAQ